MSKYSGHKEYLVKEARETAHMIKIREKQAADIDHYETAARISALARGEDRTGTQLQLSLVTYYGEIQVLRDKLYHLLEEIRHITSLEVSEARNLTIRSARYVE